MTMGLIAESTRYLFQRLPTTRCLPLSITSQISRIFTSSRQFLSTKIKEGRWKMLTLFGWRVTTVATWSIGTIAIMTRFLPKASLFTAESSRDGSTRSLGRKESGNSQKISLRIAIFLSSFCSASSAGNNLIWFLKLRKETTRLLGS